MLELILIRGLPGSGKSTLAKKFTKLNYVWFETDMYFLSETGNYVFVKNKLPQAHAWCQWEAETSLEAGCKVVVSNTFSRIWEMQPYIDMAAKWGAKLTVITCEGDWGNIHNVPEETIKAMRSRWEPYGVSHESKDSPDV